MKCYINCPYEEKDEAKKLGAKWDPEKRSWYFDYITHKSESFKKWLPPSVALLPDLSANINEPYKPDHQKYFLMEAKDVKPFIFVTGINEYGDIYNLIFSIKKEWACCECMSDDLLEYLGDNEECSDEEYECALEKCRLKHANDPECCDSPIGGGGGDIDNYIEIEATIHRRIKYSYQYLGQFKNLDECRAYLANYSITE
ncbi:DUF5710 domain-containing protein [Acetivibrio clariflavus]|uniref:DUF5710 domain-containing protein n=1 Tax=Acetivibrio clariflavus TaxID=288965 RepID=UPI000304D78D|nr:DUF5710 domain-containing protein [Acetivibrio clariflavus]